MIDDMDQKHSDLPPPLKMPGFNIVNAAHTLIEAAEDVRWDFDDKAAFLKRVKHIEFGLGAEDEFAALLAWLGRCDLVHRNGQKWQSSNEGTKWHIPDLFAVFRRGGNVLSAMIEVKTTAAGTLQFRESYVEGLRQYSALHSQPLLIAWRPREYGFWILFDPDLLQKADGKLAIDFETAYMHNLLGCIAGDFAISRMEGAGLYFFMPRVSEIVPSENGHVAEFVYDEIGWRDVYGLEHENLPRAVKYMLLTNAHFLEVGDDDRKTRAIVATGGMVHAQDVFRSLVTGWLREDEPARWNFVQENRETLLPRDELYAGLQSYFGTFVKYIIQQALSTWPRFLPEAWKTFSD